MAALALHKIFVYGTLKRGQSNHYLLESAQNGIARLLGPAKLTKEHPMILTTCGIPMLLAKEGTGKAVKGELYEVDDVMLAVMDNLEDHPDLYTRTPTLCHLITPPQAPGPGPTLCHLITPPQAPGPGPTSTATTDTNVSITECETYMVFNFKEDVLKLAFMESFDEADLPEDKKILPKKERTREHLAAIAKSLYSIKRDSDRKTF